MTPTTLIGLILLPCVSAVSEPAPGITELEVCPRTVMYVYPPSRPWGGPEIEAERRIAQWPPRYEYRVPAKTEPAKVETEPPKKKVVKKAKKKPKAKTKKKRRRG